MTYCNDLDVFLENLNQLADIIAPDASIQHQDKLGSDKIDSDDHTGTFYLYKIQNACLRLGIAMAFFQGNGQFHQKSGNFNIFSFPGPKSALFGPEWDLGGPCVKPFINTTKTQLSVFDKKSISKSEQKALHQVKDLQQVADGCVKPFINTTETQLSVFDQKSIPQSE